MPTILIAFDERSFSLYEVFIALPITVGVKNITVEVEVIDCPVEYDVLLGRNWTYAMKIVPSTMFHTISFPHLRKRVTIDQLDFCTTNLRTNTETTIPLVGDSSSKPEMTGVGLFKDSSLMGVFPSSPPDPPLTIPTNMISTDTSHDPWIIPHPNKLESHGTVMSLPPIEKSYMEILAAETPAEINPNQPLDFERDQFSLPSWENNSPLSHEFLENILPSDKTIMEVMALTKWPWEDLHHHS